MGLMADLGPILTAVQVAGPCTLASLIRVVESLDALPLLLALAHRRPQPLRYDMDSQSG
jgi:hypothetical protein